MKEGSYIFNETSVMATWIPIVSILKLW